jgi:hypothetical protein
MRNKIAYLLICLFFLIFQFISLLNQTILYTDNEYLIIIATLIVIFLPGLLIYPFFESMMISYKEYGFSSFLIFSLAFSFVLQFFLCIFVFILEINIYFANLIFFCINVIFYILSFYKILKGYIPYIKFNIKFDPINNLLFLFFFIVMSHSLYKLGACPYDISGEMLLQMATVRKIFENPYLAIDNVSYASGIVNTYIFPLWQFIIALISKIAHIDPLIVFFKLRWVGIFSIVAVYSIVNLIFKDNRYKNALIMNIIATFVFIGISITDYKAITITDVMNRGVFHLLPTPHTADIAMTILMPVGIYLVLFYTNHSNKIFNIFLISFFTMLAVFHVREYFQIFFYLLTLSFVIFFIDKKKIKSYFGIFINILIAGLLIFILQLVYAEYLPHVSSEIEAKIQIINDIIEILKSNPLLLFKKADFLGFADLNMNLCLLTLYFLPFFLFIVNKNINTMFIIFAMLLSFLCSQTLLFKKMLILITYSEFFVSTARLIFIFVFIIISYMLAKILVYITIKTEQFFLGFMNNRIIISTFSNIIGMVFIAFIFIILFWYIKDARLEMFLKKFLYPATWITFFFILIVILKKREINNDNFSSNAFNQNKKFFLILPSLCLLLIAFLISPNFMISVKKNKSQSENLWTTNVITDIPIDLIKFIRKNIPEGSNFATNTASKISLFLYANIYVDHFPPLICSNIEREIETDIKKFDKKRPIYGEYTDMEQTKRYINLNNIKYILIEPDSLNYLKDRYEKESLYFKKIYDKNGYIIYEVTI